MGGLPPALGGASIVVALAVAGAAVYWPALQHVDTVTGLPGCPMGFGSKTNGDGLLPEGHPPVLTRRDNSSAAQLLVYTNATVWTADAQNPWAEAFAVRDGRLEVIGSAASLAKLYDFASSVIDLQGRFVTPGFVDAHVHLIPGGLALTRVDLAQARSKNSFITAVKNAAAEKPEGQWIFGGGWNEERWGGELPSAAWLDTVAPAHPVYLTRMDGHSALINSVAMHAAGIDDSTPDPDGGEIIRDATGSATGLITESAMQLVLSKLLSLTHDERVDAAVRAGHHALKHGITTVHDLGRPPFMGSNLDAWDDLEGPLMAAADAGQLPIRIFAYMPLSTWKRAADLIARRGRAHPGGRLLWGSMKAFADGSLGSRTALMRQPYTDVPGNRGMWATPRGELSQLIHEADAAGLEVAIHAIGDEAVDEVTAMLASAARINSANRTSAAPRHRIEHVQHMAGPATAAAIAAAGAVAVVNPLHLLDDRDMMLLRLGPDRSGAGQSFAYQTLQKAGVPQAYGSDWPVVPIGALSAVYAATERREPGSQAQPFVPSERVTAEAALRAHTLGAAYAAGMEDEVGMLRAGMRADFAVLSASPLVHNSDSLAPPDVLQTYVDGLCAFGCTANATPV